MELTLKEVQERKYDMKNKVLKRAGICCTMIEADGVDDFYMEFQCLNMKEPNSIKFYLENISELEGICNYIIDLANELKKQQKEAKKGNGITLEQLKARAIDPETAERFERTKELWSGNIRAIRHRMNCGEPFELRSCIFSMTHNGNDPKSNEELLNDARMYIEKGVYTDEEWEKWFVPAINEMLEYNNHFERWMPGYLIRHKETKELYLVEYDYALAFGYLSGHKCRNYTSLSVCALGKDGHITGTYAWRDYDNFELVDKDHAEKNIAKIRAFVQKGSIPYSLSSEISQMYYGREAPVTDGTKI